MFEKGEEDVARIVSTLIAIALTILLIGCSAVRPRLEAPLNIMEYTRTLDLALLEESAKSGGPGMRARAAVVAGRVEDPGAVSLLAGLLDDRDEGVCVASAFALGRIGGEEAEKALRRQSLREPSPVVRAAAIGALGWAGTSDSAAALRDLLDHGDPRIRGRAALSLGLLAYRKEQWDAPAVGLLVAQLDDAAPEARWGAAYALMQAVLHGMAGQDDGLIPALFDALDDQDYRVGMAAARALGAVTFTEAGSGTAGVDFGLSAAGALASRCMDPNWMVAVEAIKAAGTMAARDEEGGVSKMIAGALLERTTDANEHVRLTAIEALGSQESEAECKRMVRFAQSERWRERAAAARAIGRFASTGSRRSAGGQESRATSTRTDAWNALSALTRDPDWRVRTASATALGRGKGEKDGMRSSALSLLWSLAADTDPRVRPSAIEAIDAAAGEVLPGEIGEKIAATLLTDDPAVLVTVCFA